MTDEFLPIAEVSLADDEIEAAVEVLESGNLVQGERVSAFEEQFADAVGADNAVAVSSGTAALHVAYLATIPDGSEVLVPAMSHISTANMVTFANAKPVFCDVDENTFTLDVEDARNRVTEKTSAIVPVHLFGNVCDIEAVRSFAEDHGLTVIWDAAQAHGSTYEGRDVGSFEDCTTYSFYPTKTITTTEGGMITTNDDQVAETCRRLRSHWEVEKYHHPNVGLNYRMTEVEAAIGVKQLDKLDEFVAARRKNAKALTMGLEDVPSITPPIANQRAEHSYHQYSILIDIDELGCSRKEFRQGLRERGIGTAVHYPTALHEQPAFDVATRLPTSEWVCERICSLPVHPSLTESERAHIVDAVNAVVESFQ